jgi:hypothetical protein
MSRDTTARPELRRRELLRRPGLHGPQVARRDLRSGAVRRFGLHQTGTTTELNLPTTSRPTAWNTSPVVFEKLKKCQRGLRRRPLRRLHHRRSRASIRSAPAADQSGDHIVLPEIISKEPLGPVVRQGDDQWFNIVKWTLFAMLNAEELGVTSANVDEMMRAPTTRASSVCSASKATSAKRSACPTTGPQRHQACRQLRRDLQQATSARTPARHRAA